MKTHIPKYYFFYIFFFALLYLEDRIFFMNMSLSNIWKIFTVFGLLLFVIQKKKKQHVAYLDVIIILLSFSLLINSHGFFSIQDVTELILLLVLPISYYSFYYFYKVKPDKLKNALLVFSTFLILSSIPFIFNIIESVNEFNDSLVEFAEKYESSSRILIGFFKQPSISSKVFVFSSIVVWVFGIYNVDSSKNVRFFFIIILFIGLYDVYLSFTRTGWIMIITFIFTFVMFNKSQSPFKKIFILLIIVGALFYLFNSNQAIQNRILGKNVTQSVQNSDLNSISNGRLFLMARTINSVLEEDKISLFLGLGRKYALEKNDGALAHNRFIEIFAFGGLVSLFLYLIYLYQIYIEIRKRKSSNITYSLSISLYIIMILALIPSHGLALWADVIFGGVIALNRIEYEKINEECMKIPY